MAFSTTIVVNGHGEAIVTETGMNTKVGKIAKMIITNEAPETPIQKKLGEVGKTLGIACLGICLLIFIIGLLKKIEPIEMFMTSVGLAVAAIGDSTVQQQKVQGGNDVVFKTNNLSVEQREALEALLTSGQTISQAILHQEESWRNAVSQTPEC